MSVNISDGFGITIDETTLTKKVEAPTTTWLNLLMIVFGILTFIIIIYFIKSLTEELKD